MNCGYATPDIENYELKKLVESVGSRQTLSDIAEQLDVHFHAVGNLTKQDKWDEAPKHVPKTSSSSEES